MRMYGCFITNKLKSAGYAFPRVDFMEFEFPKLPREFVPEDLENDENVIVACDWDESGWSYDQEKAEGSFECKGVMLNMKYANGHTDLFKDAILDAIQIYGPEDMTNFRLKELLIEDDGSTYEFPAEKLTPREYLWDLEYTA